MHQCTSGGNNRLCCQESKWELYYRFSVRMHWNCTFPLLIVDRVCIAVTHQLRVCWVLFDRHIPERLTLYLKCLYTRLTKIQKYRGYAFMQHIWLHNCTIVVVSGKNVRRRIAIPTIMAFSVESEKRYFQYLWQLDDKVKTWYKEKLQLLGGIEDPYVEGSSVAQRGIPWYL